MGAVFAPQCSSDASVKELWAAVKLVKESTEVGLML